MTHPSISTVAPNAERIVDAADSESGPRRHGVGRLPPYLELLRRTVAEPASALVLVAVLATLVHLVLLLTDYRHLFVHPDWHQRILPESLRDGLNISYHDLIDSMQQRAEGESRPRWLTYLIVDLDQKLRLWLYQWMPVHPTLAPVAWFFQLIVAPYYLYRLVCNLTGNRVAAWAGIAVYLSSNGFLSGFTMQFAPGKTLSNTIFIVSLYAASLAARTLRPGQILVEAKSLGTYILPIVLCIGLFIDEMPIAAFLIVPLVFWSHFVPKTPSHLGMFLKNSLLLILPGLAFLFVVVVVAPPIIEQYFGFQFDYLADTFLIGGHTRTGTSLVDGQVPLTLGIIVENFTTLFGLSLAPWFISPFITSPYGPFPGSQVTNLPKLLIFLAFFGTIALVSIRARGTLAVQLRGLIVGMLLFVLFLSFLSIRHIPIVTGYYYGAGFASLFALLVALLVAGLDTICPSARLVAAIATLVIVGVQIINYGPINDGWIVTHNEQLTRAMVQKLRPGLQKRLPLRSPQDLSPDELQAIWTAWKRDRLDEYLRDGHVSTAAIYEVFELREIDHAQSD